MLQTPNSKGQTPNSNSNSDAVIRFIAQHGVAAEVVQPQADTSTVETAAAAVGTVTDHIVKSLVFVADGTLVLALACGTGKVDAKKIADYLGLSRKRVKLADPATVQEQVGYTVGATPPFGHKIKLRTLIDEKVLKQSEVYAAAGALDVLIRLTPAELARATAAETVKVGAE